MPWARGQSTFTETSIALKWLAGYAIRLIKMGVRDHRVLESIWTHPAISHKLESTKMEVGGRGERKKMEIAKA